MGVDDYVLVGVSIAEAAPIESIRPYMPRSVDEIGSQAWCFSLQAMEEETAKQKSRWKGKMRAGFPALLHNHRSGDQRGTANDPPPEWKPGLVRCNPGCKILFGVPAGVAAELEAEMERRKEARVAKLKAEGKA